MVGIQFVLIFSWTLIEVHWGLVMNVGIWALILMKTGYWSFEDLAKQADISSISGLIFEWQVIFEVHYSQRTVHLHLVRLHWIKCIWYDFMIFGLNINTLRPRQNGHHFADYMFKWIFLNENVWILLKISLKFVPKVWINNIPALVQIMAWRRPGDKPLSEPMVVSLLTHICITRPQWVNPQTHRYSYYTASEIILHMNTCHILKNIEAIAKGLTFVRCHFPNGLFSFCWLHFLHRKILILAQISLKYSVLIGSKSWRMGHSWCWTSNKPYLNHWWLTH